MYRRLSAESLRLEADGLTHVSGPESGLRQLAGSDEDDALALLAATLQPLGAHEQFNEPQLSTVTVFNRLVDFVRPDPPLRRQFELLVNGAIQGNAADIERLDAIFHSWVEAATALDQIEAQSPLLQQVPGHIADWPKLGMLGIESLGYLRSRSAPPASWRDQQSTTLRDAVRPRELVEFVVLGPLQLLVDAVGSPDARHQLATRELLNSPGQQH
jgi:hexosaminidase